MLLHGVFLFCLTLNLKIIIIKIERISQKYTFIQELVMKHRYLIAFFIALFILSALTSCGVEDKYKIVTPTEEEMGEIELRLNPIFSTYFDNYDYSSEDMYNNLFSYNQLKYVCPEYKEEIAKFVDRPLDFPYGNACWSITVYGNDPLGVFGKISEKAYDDNGKVDIDLAYSLLQPGDVIGYNKFSGAYIDWLIEGVWNGKVNHDTAFNFDDGSQCYYHDGYYYTPEKISALGGGIFHYTKVNSISLIEKNKYEIKYAVFDENDMQAYIGSATVALKESKGGFRFWSIYSINVESCN